MADCGGRILTEAGGRLLTEAGDYLVIEGYIPCPTDDGAGSGGRGRERPWTVVPRPEEDEYVRVPERVTRETEGERRVELPEPLEGEAEEAYILRAREEVAARLALLGAIEQLEAVFAVLMMQQRLAAQRDEEEALLAVLMAVA